MTLPIKLLRSRITSDAAIAKNGRAGRVPFVQSSFSYKPINSTTMTKTQLNSVFGGMPLATPIKARTQLD